MDRLSISTIICTYAADRWDALTAALRSVERQERPTDEIIISVDHNPALADRLRAEFHGAIVVENSEERGLSGARNSGIRAAKSAIVAFLDDDAVANRDWLTWIESGYEDANVVGVGGSIDPDWAHGRPAWFPEEFDWVVGCTYRGMPRSKSPVRNLIGANMSFRRQLFESVGGFRSGIGRVGTLPVGCEETEFCIRVRQRFPSTIFLYEPRAKIAHFIPEQRASWRYFARRCYAEGKSKTAISQHVGKLDGTATERQYTLRTLPAGVARGLRDSTREVSVDGLARSAAIVAGLAITTGGFAASEVLSVDWRHRRSGRMEPPPNAGSHPPAPDEQLHGPNELSDETFEGHQRITAEV